jgi:hypothetical protein
VGCVWNKLSCTRPGVGLGESFEKGDGLSTIGTSNDKFQNCNFSAIFLEDGNFVVYQGSKVIWISNTAGKNATRAQFQQDGNFVIAAGTTELFNSVKTRLANKVPRGFSLGQNGNLVILDTSNQVIWASQSVVPGCY